MEVQKGKASNAMTPEQAAYQSYLRSPEWRARRERILRRDGYACTNCGGIPATQVHHTRYPMRWGQEKDEWLVSLCEPCHRAVHLAPFEKIDDLPY